MPFILCIRETLSPRRKSVSLTPYAWSWASIPRTFAGGFCRERAVVKAVPEPAVVHHQHFYSKLCTLSGNVNQLLFVEVKVSALPVIYYLRDPIIYLRLPKGITLDGKESVVPYVTNYRRPVDGFIAGISSVSPAFTFEIFQLTKFSQFTPFASSSGVSITLDGKESVVPYVTNYRRSNQTYTLEAEEYFLEQKSLLTRIERVSPVLIGCLLMDLLQVYRQYRQHSHLKSIMVCERPLSKYLKNTENPISLLQAIRSWLPENILLVRLTS